jgi:hypothetical protein
MAVKKSGSSALPKILGIVGGVVVAVVIVALLIAGRGSPVDVAMAFYRAGNEGNYEKAATYLFPSIERAWEMLPSIRRFDTAMDAATKDGTITRIEATETIEVGGVATVWLTLDYRDGSREEDILTLMKVDGEWRVYMSTLLLMPSPP